MSDKRPLIYILGPSYSGSTLLTFLLARHPKIATIGELKGTSMGDISGYRCSCGELIESCPFWKKIAEQMTAGGHLFSLQQFGTHFREGGLPAVIVGAEMRGKILEGARKFAMRFSRSADHLKKVLAQNAAMVNAICELQCRPVFLDGSKDAIRLRHFVEAEQFDVRVIRLERDGRGVSLSYARHHNCNFEQGVREWLLTQKHSNAVAATCTKTRIEKVCYEEMCSNTDSVLKRIQAAMGLEPVDLLSRSETPGNVHIVGNDMRLSPPTELRLDERWRRDLTARELAFFERKAGTENRALGYE